MPKSRVAKLCISWAHYLVRFRDAPPASLVSLTVWVLPRTLTRIVPEMPYSRSQKLPLYKLGVDQPVYLFAVQRNCGGWPLLYKALTRIPCT
jgi:hypothetical protein